MTDFLQGSGMIEFKAPIVDYVKFAGAFWVYLANGDIYRSSDGRRFELCEITVRSLVQ